MPEQNAQAATVQSASQPQAGGQPNTSFTATDAAHSQADTGASGTTDSDTNGATSGMSLEELQRELAKTRREAAEHRTARRKLEADAQAAAQAQMTKEERLAAQVADGQKERETLAAKYQARMLAYEVQLQAQALGIIDPDAAVKLLDASRIEYDDEGAPKNLGKLLRELVAAKTYLVAPANQGQQTGQQNTGAQAPASASSATNTATGASRTTLFTESQIASMSPEDYAKNRAAIFQAQREGRIRPG